VFGLRRADNRKVPIKQIIRRVKYVRTYSPQVAFKLLDKY
jgi:hypothetical protein